MPIPPFRLEHVIDACTAQTRSLAQRRTLRQLTGVKLPLTETERAWERIMDHKWYLSERLRRDVGLKVAAIDYFENIAPPVASRTRRTGGNRLPAPLPMMLPLSR